MKWIKTFEAFGGYALPTTSMDVLLEYNLCKDCNALYRVYKPKYSVCKYCGSKDVSHITEEDYYNELQNRIDDPEEWKDILKDREDTRNTFVDLTTNSEDYTN